MNKYVYACVCKNINKKMFYLWWIKIFRTQKKAKKINDAILNLLIDFADKRRGTIRENSTENILCVFDKSSYMNI